MFHVLRIPSRFAVIAAALAVSASSLLGAAPATSQPPPLSQVAMPAWASELPPEELSDLEVMAKEEGITVAEAVSKYGWEESFSEAVANVQAAYPEQFSSTGLFTDGQPDPVVRFVGAVPKDAAALFDAVPIEVRLEGGADVSEASLRAAVQDVHYSSLKRISKDVSISTRAEAETSLITIELGGGTPSELAGATSAAADTARQAALPSGVSVEVLDSGGHGADETIRGGAILNYELGGTGSLECTSGWPVKKTSGSSEGLVTAAHCSGHYYYSGRDVLTYEASIPKSSGDIEYRSSTEDVGHEFYYGVGTYRDIDAPYGVPANDQSICFFGRTTGNHCDTVRDNYICYNDFCNLVEMDHHDTEGGDSGGPWYVGAHPYGVHKGWHTSWFHERAIWTPIYNTLNNDLSLKIKLGSDG